MHKKAAKPRRENLVSTYIEVSIQDGRPFADELRRLNDLTGLTTTHSRIKQYERGDVQPTKASINHMLATVLENKLQALGLTTQQIKGVIESCQLPDKIEVKPTRKRRVNSGKKK